MAVALSVVVEGFDEVLDGTSRGPSSFPSSWEAVMKRLPSETAPPPEGPRDSEEALCAFCVG